MSKALELETTKFYAIELSQATTTSSIATINKIFNKKKNTYLKIPRPKASPKRIVNYEQSSIAGLCLRCGKNNDFAKECRLSS